MSGKAIRWTAPREVGSGQHTVQVQAATTDATHATYFWLGERSLTVESAIHP